MTTKTTLINIQGRLFDRLVPDGDCLVWPGAKNHFGHGLIKFGGRNWIVSRLVWVLVNGEVPEGLFVLHSCDNPSCALVEHLFLGTLKDNNDDRDRKGRHGQKNKTHCPQGHAYSPENTYHTNAGRRMCKECGRIRDRARRA